MLKRITIVAEINTTGGFGQHAIQMIRWFSSHGYFVSVRPIKVSENPKARIPVDIKEMFVSRSQPESVEILLCPPHHLPTAGKGTIYFTMWESTELRPESISMLNRAEVVVVPCRWCADNFRVSVPVEIVPLGVDLDIYKHQPISPEDTFVFGSAGNLGNGYNRKGINDVVAAFRLAFRNQEDVVLRIKTTEEFQPRNPLDDRIHLNTEYLTDQRMSEWYAGLDCYVSGSKSEGFGLMPLQAMAVGRPVIAGRHSGQMDYLDESNSLPVEYTVAPAGDIWVGLGSWYKLSINSLAKAMRWAYQNRDEMITKGHHAAQSAQRFSWDVSNQMLDQIVRIYV